MKWLLIEERVGLKTRMVKHPEASHSKKPLALLN